MQAWIYALKSVSNFEELKKNKVTSEQSLSDLYYWNETFLKVQCKSLGIQRWYKIYKLRKRFMSAGCYL